MMVMMMIQPIQQLSSFPICGRSRSQSSCKCVVVAVHHQPVFRLLLVLDLRSWRVETARASTSSSRISTRHASTNNFEALVTFSQYEGQTDLSGRSFEGNQQRQHFSLLVLTPKPPHLWEVYHRPRRREGATSDLKFKKE